MSDQLNPYHSPPFPIPRFHRDTIKIDIVRLVEIGMLKPIQKSEWTFHHSKSQTSQKAKDYQEQCDSLPTFASEQTSSTTALSASNSTVLQHSKVINM